MARISTRELFLFRFRSVLAEPTRPNLYISSAHYCSSSSSLKPCLLNPRILSVLDSCQTLAQITQMHTQLITWGLFDSFWARKLLKSYWDYGDINFTILTFRYIEKPGAFCVNTVIKAHSDSSEPGRALVVYFEWLRRGFAPTSYSFVPLFGACSKLGDVECGRKCHGQVLKHGVESVLPVGNSLIHMYCCCGRVELARKVFDEMPKRDVVSWNAIVDGYARFGDLNVAHMVFDAMPERNVVAWNAMLGGYWKGGKPGCALKLFRDMVRMGMKADSTAMVNMLAACGRSGRLKEGRSVHGYLIRAFTELNVIVETALIDMYCKCKRVEVARVVFESMAYRNLVCWNAMILGHCFEGNPEDGLSLFSEMLGRTESNDGETIPDRLSRPTEGRRGILPDETTFIGVLCACARAGLLRKARDYFRQMINVFHLKPQFAHYWCMANVYVGVGLIQEAEEMIRKMPEVAEDLTKESLAWANVLGSCRFQKDVTVGEQIAISLIDMEPQNIAYYRLLLNVYAAAGQWEDVAWVKEMMKENKVRRLPGCNLVDLNEIVHKSW
ncbi:putative tetratricopeptide-like helical domain-containing protein [Rosa chinensis]|uniref:Putative tetratricopeptide-like helical domain-containing protein n=1 Tax=Rosa chinensis TaxID=74649 RepID=A0A2P6RLP1_ROSCH|nr:pentatricopeptide repeat-containing protein At3g51320 [Rosa chinensis]PRQ47354.1 putative tetratricopeptide-like helical domain-containing protein [Rosa chinensis]